jgi:tagaturonate epimerase
MVEQVNYHRPEPLRAQRWLEQVQVQFGGMVYGGSFLVQEGVIGFLSRLDGVRTLWLAWDGKAPAWVDDFKGQPTRLNLDGQVFTARRCAADAGNSTALRQVFAFTRPRLVGLRKSFGFGDRLGLATPGHILALRDHKITPIFAQQSIREMTRSRRTAQQVMDDACWSVFQAGFDRPFGSDADHLKNEADIDVCAKAGFLMFTIDPGDHVDDKADTDDAGTIQEKANNLPWAVLQTTAQDLVRRYEDKVNLPDGNLAFPREKILRAAVKYGRAIAHTLTMYRHLVAAMGEGNFELEVSVDETASPTSPQEHYYVAGELRRLNVKWVSLAPRFVGRFEKGVDYIGDLNEFRREFLLHVQVARALGPYKLSIHSGSDKFSVYPIASDVAGDLIHVKTAGTSYLEALRVIAKLEPGLFRQILDFARGRYLEDRASYHVSADLSKVPPARDLTDYHLSRLLDDFDAREVLHVTYGSVLTTIDSAGQLKFRDPLLRALVNHEEAYHQCLQEHFRKHVEPFTK